MEYRIEFLSMLENFVAQVRIFAINKGETESDVVGAADEILGFIAAQQERVEADCPGDHDIMLEKCTVCGQPTRPVHS